MALRMLSAGPSLDRASSIFFQLDHLFSAWSHLQQCLQQLSAEALHLPCLWQHKQMTMKLSNQIMHSMIIDIESDLCVAIISPSKRVLHTSSLVASSALSIIAMFCDFLGSSTLFSWLHRLPFAPFAPILDDLRVELETNNVSIISSFTLLSHQEANRSIKFQSLICDRGSKQIDGRQCKN
jgi:hypothetical protein